MCTVQKMYSVNVTHCVHMYFCISKYKRCPEGPTSHVLVCKRGTLMTSPTDSLSDL